MREGREISDSMKRLAEVFTRAVEAGPTEAPQVIQGLAAPTAHGLSFVAFAVNPSMASRVLFVDAEGDADSVIATINLPTPPPLPLISSSTNPVNSPADLGAIMHGKDANTIAVVSGNTDCMVGAPSTSFAYSLSSRHSDFNTSMRLVHRPTLSSALSLDPSGPGLAQTALCLDQEFLPGGITGLGPQRLLDNFALFRPYVAREWEIGGVEAGLLGEEVWEKWRKRIDGIGYGFVAASEALRGLGDASRRFERTKSRLLAWNQEADIDSAKTEGPPVIAPILHNLRQNPKTRTALDSSARPYAPVTTDRAGKRLSRPRTIRPNYDPNKGHLVSFRSLAHIESPLDTLSALRPIAQAAGGIAGRRPALPSKMLKSGDERAGGAAEGGEEKEGEGGYALTDHLAVLTIESAMRTTAREGVDIAVQFTRVFLHWLGALLIGTLTPIVVNAIFCEIPASRWVEFIFKERSSIEEITDKAIAVLTRKTLNVGRVLSPEAVLYDVIGPDPTSMRLDDEVERYLRMPEKERRVAANSGLPLPPLAAIERVRLQLAIPNDLLQFFGDVLSEMRSPLR
ncbi:hypothetical protein JCM10296v2_007391 [Rhodotorula toruloides]